jgi:predicted Zn-dependent peptidase
MEKTDLIVNKGKWRLHATKTDKFKVSYLSFRFIMPKDAYRTPLTKLKLSVMMRGSEHYPTVTELNRRLDELYDTTLSLTDSSLGDKCVFSVSCKMLNNKFLLDGDDTDVLLEAVKIVEDILCRPLLDQEGLLRTDYVESEKKIAIDSIRSIVNDQRAYALKKCLSLMLEGTPYGISISGDEETVSAFTARELTENIRYFKENALVECLYIGAEDAERVAEIIGDRFDCFTALGADKKYSEAAFVSPRDSVTRAGEPMDVSQSRIAIGCTCGTLLSDKDYFAMLLANEIFGGSSTSKLFMNVREKKSLCYYCYSGYRSDRGTIRIECGVAPRNADAAIDEIAHQLSELKAGNISDAEIDTAKKTVISGLVQNADSPAAITAFILRRILAGIEQTVEDCIVAIGAVTKHEIIAAAGKIKLDTVFVLEGNDDADEEDDYE